MSALLSLFLVLVLPTAAGTVALTDDPPERGHDSRPCAWDLALARGLACGLSAWLLGSGLLARTVGLTATSAWLWASLVAAHSGTAGSPRDAVDVIARIGLQEGRMLRIDIPALPVADLRLTTEE